MFKLNKTIRINKNNEIGSSLLYFWLLLFLILTAVRFVLAKFGIESGIFREIILWIASSIPILLFIFNIEKFEPKKYSWFFIMLFIIIFIMIISLLLNPDLYEFYMRKSYGLDRILRPDSAIFAALFFSITDDDENIIDILTKISIIFFMYLILVDFLPMLKRGYWVDIGPDGNRLKLDYNLSFGYNLTFPCIIFIYNFIFNKKKLFIIPAIFSAIMILIYGNRGALLVIFVYLFLITLKSLDDVKLIKKIFIVIIFILLFLIFKIYYENIMLFLLKKANELNLESRSIRMMLNGKFSQDNGRDVIWEAVIEAIKANPIFGYGILGDRPFVAPIHYVGYTHNLFLENIISFGVIGHIINIALLLVSLKMIFKCSDKKTSDLFIILFSISCQLLISMSFWYVWQFWAAIGIYVKYKKRNRNILIVE